MASNLTARTYLELTKISLLKPQQLNSSIKNYRLTRDALAFFIINITLGSLVKAASDIFYYRNLGGIFVSITEISLFIPVAILGLVLISIPLHLLAKLLGGKGKFKATFQAVAYSSSPFLLFWIPLSRPIMLILLTLLLISNFRAKHQYTLNQALINILVPVMLLVIALLIMGIGY